MVDEHHAFGMVVHSLIYGRHPNNNMHVVTMQHSEDLELDCRPKKTLLPHPQGILQT